jgi:hypothetical protein
MDRDGFEFLRQAVSCDKIKLVGNLFKAGFYNYYEEYCSR